jgi:hypothetical protein
MRKTTMKTLAALLLGALWLTAPAARADVKSCLRDAKNTYAGCQTGCKNAFHDDVANCKGIAPGCLSACIDAREACLTNAEAPLADCIAQNGCDAIVENAKPTCRSQCGCGGAGNPCGFNACYVRCLDPYEQLRFSCKDSCRNQWQLNGGPTAENQCRSAFRACTAACPPAP